MGIKSLKEEVVWWQLTSLVDKTIIMSLLHKLHSFVSSLLNLSFPMLSLWKSSLTYTYKCKTAYKSLSTNFTLFSWASSQVLFTSTVLRYLSTLLYCSL